MHRTQADHHAANLYTDVLPGTLLVKDDLNAFQEELARTVEDSGQTLAASGAADQAAGWHQLTEAIRRLPLVQADDVTITLTGSPTTLAPTAGQNFIRLERSGGADPNVTFPNNVAYLGRIITIRNSANLVAQIKDRRGFISLLAHHGIEQYQCFIDDDGVNYNWAPMSGEYSGIFTANYTLDNAVASIGPNDFLWKKKGYLVTLMLPLLSDVATGTVNAGNLVSVALPNHLRGAGGYSALVLLYDAGGGTDIFVSANTGSPSLVIPGVVNTNIQIRQQVIQYWSSNELLIS